jgi:cytochrome b6-f complex iron-sulfur subunit
MERSEFLRLLGLAGGGVVLTACLEGCKKENVAPSTLSRDFTLDLTAPANSALAQNGGYMVVQQVIVARTTSGSFIAVAAACTHQGATVQYQSSSNSFRCPAHGARFSSSGGVTNGPANTALQQFNTQLNGNSLRIYS